MSRIQLNIPLNMASDVPLATSDDPPVFGTRVVFLDGPQNGFNYAAHQPGRIGTYHEMSANRHYFTCEADGNYASHERIVVLNPDVDYGDRVMVLRRQGDHYTNPYNGYIGIVAHVSEGGGVITVANAFRPGVTGATNQIGLVSHWVRANPADTTPASAAVASGQEDVPELPEYWENRVRTIAREYSRRYGMCSRVDQALTEIFSVNQRYRVGNQNGTVIVRDPQGNEIASFTGPNPQQHAEILVRQLNAQQRPAA